MTRTRRSLLAGAALLAVLAVGACSHSPGASGSAGGDNAGRAAVVGSGPDVVAAPSASSAPSSSSGGNALSPGGQARDAAVRLTVGSKIRTARMTVAVKGAADVAARANRAEAIATAAGGEVDADNRTSGRHAEADLVLRVPPDQLTPVLTQLGALGTEKSRELGTRDVTEQVADVTSRVASAKQAITRLRALYGNAVKVSDVISIESELSSREADLESLQAQQRSLAAQTSLATISLTLDTAAKPVVHKHAKHARHGFLAGLSRGWHDFTSAASAAATGIGAAVPFAALVLLLALAARLLWTRLPHRTAHPAAPAAAGPAE